MATATSLAQAAGQAFDNLDVRWLANALKASLTLFWKNTIGLFPEADVTSHPVSNWLTVIAALADQMPATNVPIEQLTAAAEFVFRLCWMASFLQTSGGITNAQAISLLSFYNAIIGF
jgi:hypothetical protein